MSRIRGHFESLRWQDFEVHVVELCGESDYHITYQKKSYCLTCTGRFVQGNLLGFPSIVMFGYK